MPQCAESSDFRLGRCEKTLLFAKYPCASSRPALTQAAFGSFSTAVAAGDGLRRRSTCTTSGGGTTASSAAVRDGGAADASQRTAPIRSTRTPGCRADARPTTFPGAAGCAVAALPAAARGTASRHGAPPATAAGCGAADAAAAQAVACSDGGRATKGAARSHRCRSLSPSARRRCGPSRGGASAAANFPVWGRGGCSLCGLRAVCGLGRIRCSLSGPGAAQRPRPAAPRPRRLLPRVGRVQRRERLVWRRRGQLWREQPL